MKFFNFKTVSLIAATAMLACVFTGCGKDVGENDEEEKQEPCVHQYSDGVCELCGEECGHEFSAGVCGICGYVCGHDYINGECAVCGEAEPEPEYVYNPFISEDLPRIDVVTASGNNGWATVVVDSFDNYNPANNIDWQYNDCSISVSNCEGYEMSDVSAGIKIRGNWTTTYPKKPFRIKFDKKQSMLGLNNGAKCKSWVLLADYKDCSLERNSLAFYIGKQILGPDGYYCSDFRQVELYLNGSYWGVYLLAEQQQVNENRVGITEPEDGYQGTDIGYFIEYDGYYNLEIYAERFSCNYNNYATLTTGSGWTLTPYQNGFSIKNDVYYDDVNNCAQKFFIRDYIGNLYKLCYEAVYNHRYYTFNEDYSSLVTYTPESDNPVRETVSRVIDIRSLVDTYILNEIACDADLSWSSFCMDVDFGADGDKLLRFEAPWDFDSAFGLKESCGGGRELFAANANNPWMLIFINQGWFLSEVKDKWSELTESGFCENTLAYLKNLESACSDEYSDNFARWGFIVNGESCWEAAQVSNHAQAVNYLYNWLSTRFEFLNGIWS